MFVVVIREMVRGEVRVEKEMKDGEGSYVVGNEIWGGGEMLVGEKVERGYGEIEEWCGVRGWYEEFVRSKEEGVNIEMMFVGEKLLGLLKFDLVEGNGERLVGNEKKMVVRG